MGKITFILGGARSGKSDYALKRAKEITDSAAFVATCRPWDEEMKRRVSRHRKERPKIWKTYEAFEDMSSLLSKISLRFEVVIIDCITLLLSNLMEKKLKESAIKTEISRMLKVLEKGRAESFLVSNEVGSGIVPENRLARDFRDIAGRINQIIAQKSDEVFFLVSGIPWRIK